MNIEALRNVLARYVQLHPEDDFGIEECWAEMTDILSKDIELTIEYFQDECTDEEFYWLSSVFEDVAEQTQSTTLIKVLRERLAKVSMGNYHQDLFQTDYMRESVDYTTYIKDVAMDIDYAEACVDAGQQ